MATSRYFIAAMLFTVIGLGVGTWIGYLYSGTLDGAISAFLICAFLAVLEVSLSFDNAIVNARILHTMEPRWQRRFLSWGIVIAVFGMRILFPLVIVAIAARLNPIDAVRLAIHQPAAYSDAMDDAHLGISAFGGTFLLMVAFRFFFDHEKEVHWLSAIEAPLSSIGAVRSIDIGLVLALVLIDAAWLPDGRWIEFVEAAIWGLVTFLAVDALGAILDRPDSSADVARKAGLGAFLYLEMLDASFSFDGVVGAFALSSNLFVIAIGLGIGAFYIRAMTIVLVEKQTLAEYRYLEHGAFYAIVALAVIMLTQVHFHIPEMVTGLIGAALIVSSFVGSVLHNRQTRPAREPA